MSIMDCIKGLSLILIVFCLYLVNFLKAQDFSTCQKCTELDEKKTNVHLIPHSHFEEGWLRTFDQYYNDDPGVKSILNSTMKALTSNESRRFVLAEIAFFSKWWKEQSTDVQTNVKNLVSNGQLEFVNGGWSLGDEATSHYQSIVDQFTLGFKFLNDTFGTCGLPKIGWQIHTFGHSRQYASILKQFEFEGLVIGPIAYKDFEDRQKGKELEFNWKTIEHSDDSKIFTTMFPQSYNWENGYNFDAGDEVTTDNLEEKLTGFVAILDKYKEYYKTNNIMIPMGGDLAYQKAEENFASIDTLIEGFKDDENYKMFYSTPSCYVKAVQTTNDLTVKEDDFFPYAADANSYWTGYYTSRPTLKRFERVGHNILQSVNQLTSLAAMKNSSTTTEFTTDLKEIMGVLQHHQAISGTVKQDVANNYVSMLHQAIKKTEANVGTVISTLLKKSDVDLKLSTCLLTNVSICDISQKERFLVVVQNPLARAVTHYVRLPVQEKNYKITGPDNEDVRQDVFDTIYDFSYIKDKKPSTRELVFEAKDLPPLGVKVYYVEQVDSETAVYHPFADSDGTYGEGLNYFTIKSGALESVTIKNITQNIQQEFLYYSGADGSTGKPSGAYIFNPTGSAMPLQEAADSPKTECANGTLVAECRQIINNQVRQIIRMYKGENDNYVEFDWLVGNLDVSEHGKDVITRFTIGNLASGTTFFTDANGREEIKRTLNTEDTEQLKSTSNYYPVTSKIALENTDANIRVVILNDRPQGGTSLNTGEMELMIHRREKTDDGEGLGENLDETEYDQGLYVRGQHYLALGTIESEKEEIKSAVELERDLTYKKLLAPWIFLADATGEDLNTVDKVKALINFKYEGLKTPLPDNIQIMTLEPWRKDTYLLRLETDEHRPLSNDSVVELKNLFYDFTITNFTEFNLGVTKQLEQQNDKSTSTLSSMEVKTFIIKVGKRSSSGSQPLKAVLTIIVFIISLFMLL